MKSAQAARLPGPATATSVQPGRMRVIKQGSDSGNQNGPVVYWMFRDQRLRDNWALIHAVDEANKSNVPVAVAFNLFDQFKGGKARHLGFMLRGLKQLERNIQTLGIPFFLLHGEVIETMPKFLADSGASLLVTDFSPLREIRKYKDEIGKRVSESLSIHEVDAHNVVPIWEASQKLEYGARTIRTKINKLLPKYLIEYPELPVTNQMWPSPVPSIDWDKVIEDVLRLDLTVSFQNQFFANTDSLPALVTISVSSLVNCAQKAAVIHMIRRGAEVPEVEWCKPGEAAAREVLIGSTNGFLTKRLKTYNADRNNPSKPGALSGISPYLHFGQISAQRCALEAQKVRQICPQAIDAFLEELIVRRELADNFCYYQPHYDSLQGAWEWARKTLMDHASDKREHIYTREQLEKAQTFDPLWNASQLEMVHHGKMHGFMRMYWAKKILEWTSGPEEALSVAIYLNDKYEMDGRDPNGYVGCMWSICGVHDQGWKERSVFGKIRYMNYAGCKRKFDVDAYISYVKLIVGQTKKRKAATQLIKQGAVVD